jgi:hypothetical protein
MAAKEYLGKIGQCIAHFIMPYATPIHMDAVIEKSFGISCADPKGGGAKRRMKYNQGTIVPGFFMPLRSLLNYDAVVQKYLGLASLIPRGGSQ